MTVKELCKKHGISQTNLSRRFNIPLRTVQSWHIGERQAAPYMVAMMDELLSIDESTPKASDEKN